jgi:hypothetical protein
MRKTLASVLMFVMLASATICGCGHEAQAASHADQKTESSHHADGDHHGNKDTQAAEKCQTTDMQLPAQTNVNKPDLKSSFHLDYAFIDEKPVWTVAVDSDRRVRGPPIGVDPPNAKPSILLTTQRLRI